MMLSLIKQLVQALTWLVMVAPWEQAIRVRLGRHVRKLDAGVHLRIPFVDRVFKQSIRRRVSVLRPQTLTTADGKVVTCAGAIGFSIGDLARFYDTLESPNDTIENVVSGIIAKYIGGRSLKDCSSNDLEAFVSSNLDLTRYGLNGQEFYLVSFATSKTYRLITGGLENWPSDGKIQMAESTVGPPI